MSLRHPRSKQIRPLTLARYHKNSEATAKKFATDVFKKGDLFYRSGDALRRDADGRWYFLDRLGDTYRWKCTSLPVHLSIFPPPH